MRPRRLFSYPLSLALVVAALVAVTGGWIAWWNYARGLANIRELAGALFDQIARRTAEGTGAFLMRAPPAAEALVGLAALDGPEVDASALARRFLAVLRANPGFTWVSYCDAARHVHRRVPLGGRRSASTAAGSSTARPMLDEHDVADDGAWKPVRHEADTGYDPRTRPFYALAAKAAPQAYGPQPYVFFGQDVPGHHLRAAAYRARRAARRVHGRLRSRAAVGARARELQFSASTAASRSSTGDGIVLAHPTAPVVTGAGRRRSARARSTRARRIRQRVR